MKDLVVKLSDDMETIKSEINTLRKINKAQSILEKNGSYRLSKGVPKIRDYGYVNITDDDINPPKKVEEIRQDEARGRQLEQFLSIPFWMRRDT